jgi:hypothetical protein
LQYKKLKVLSPPTQNITRNFHSSHLRNYMKYPILLAALIAVTCLSACEKTINSPSPAPATVVVSGPPGAPGATGASGADGAKGTTGTTGNDGANGATGATGNDGSNGSNGSNGATGATGATGNDGNKGDTGKTGGQTVVVVPVQK